MRSLRRSMYAILLATVACHALPSSARSPSSPSLSTEGSSSPEASPRPEGSVVTSGSAPAPDAKAPAAADCAQLKPQYEADEADYKHTCETSDPDFDPSLATMKRYPGVRKAWETRAATYAACDFVNEGTAKYKVKRCREGADEFRKMVGKEDATMLSGLDLTEGYVAKLEKDYNDLDASSVADMVVRTQKEYDEIVAAVELDYLKGVVLTSKDAVPKRVAAWRARIATAQAKVMDARRCPSGDKAGAAFVGTAKKLTKAYFGARKVTTVDVVLDGKPTQGVADGDSLDLVESTTGWVCYREDVGGQEPECAIEKIALERRMPPRGKWSAWELKGPYGGSLGMACKNLK